MAFNDPLQWIIIGVVVLVVAWIIVYFLSRVLRTLNKVDKYIDVKEGERKQSSPPMESL
jgi:di/tricarboxylate transporter